MPNDPGSDYIAVQGEEVEKIGKDDDFSTGIRKMREAGVDLYVALQLVNDLKSVKSEVAVHQMMSQIIEGEGMQPIYRLALFVLSWYEMIAEEDGGVANADR